MLRVKGTAVGDTVDCRKCNVPVIATPRMVKHHRYLCDVCWLERKRKYPPKRETIRAWLLAHREQIREYDRRVYPERVARYRNAYVIFKIALRKGVLTRQPCEVCGSEKSQAHHEDYSKPLEVRWLCRPHHTEA